MARLRIKTKYIPCLTLTMKPFALRELCSLKNVKENVNVVSFDPNH